MHTFRNRKQSENRVPFLKLKVKGENRKIRTAPYPQPIRARGENLRICFLNQLFIEPLSSTDRKLRHGVGAALPRFGGAPDTDTCRKRVRRGVGRCYLGRTRPPLWTREKDTFAMLQKVERRHLPLQSYRCKLPPLQCYHCRQNRDSQSRENRKKESYVKEKKILKTKLNHILINLIIYYFIQYIYFNLTNSKIILFDYHIFTLIVFFLS